MKRYILVSISFFLGAACSSATTTTTPNPTEGDFAKAYAPALCATYARCFPDSYTANYTDDAACVTKGEGVLTDTQKAQLSGCTKAEIDACIKDLDAEACPADTDGLKTPPVSCSGC